mmetsp:Transcript_1182/g.3107  ORF Transcript_1182/g.3107 Transcript_1182/m.3107 type:complete len:247 (-) Transcript_1182:463-1203(-)
MCEVGVRKHLLSAGSRRRVPIQQGLQDLYCPGLRLREDLLKLHRPRVAPPPLRRVLDALDRPAGLEVAGGVGKVLDKARGARLPLGHPAEDVGGGVPQDLDDAVDGVLVVEPGEEGEAQPALGGVAAEGRVLGGVLPREDLGHHAPRGPHVYGRCVVLGPHQELGGAVGARHDVVGEPDVVVDVVPGRVEVDDGPRDAEVAYLNPPEGVKEDIAGLQVPVDDAAVVNVRQAPEELPQQAPHLLAAE